MVALDAVYHFSSRVVFDSQHQPEH
jgi:hypothetical protein